MRIAALQLAVTADKGANLLAARAAIDALFVGRAKEECPELVILPECFAIPYGVAHFGPYSEPEDGETASMLSKAAKANSTVIIGGSMAESEGDRLFNTSLTFGRDGARLAKYRKSHLFDIDVPANEETGAPAQRFMESDVLTAGEEPATFAMPGGAVIGVGICFDMRFSRFAERLRRENAQVLAFPGAFNMRTGPAHWELLARARAVDTQSWVVCASPARDVEAGYVAWGHSQIVSPWGEVVASLGAEPGVLEHDCRLEMAGEIREQIPLKANPSTEI